MTECLVTSILTVLRVTTVSMAPALAALIISALAAAATPDHIVLTGAPDAEAGFALSRLPNHHDIMLVIDTVRQAHDQYLREGDSHDTPGKMPRILANLRDRLKNLPALAKTYASQEDKKSSHTESDEAEQSSSRGQRHRVDVMEVEVDVGYDRSARFR